MDVGKEFLDSVMATAARLGVELQGDVEVARNYAAARMLHLSNIVEEPGYAEALAAETVNVALKVAGEAVDSADQVDREIFGFVGGALAMGARVLAAAP